MLAAVSREIRSGRDVCWGAKTNALGARPCALVQHASLHVQAQPLVVLMFRRNALKGLPAVRLRMIFVNRTGRRAGSPLQVSQGRHPKCRDYDESDQTTVLVFFFFSWATATVIAIAEALVHGGVVSLRNRCDSM